MLAKESHKRYMALGEICVTLEKWKKETGI